jgi:hypothetical protein
MFDEALYKKCKDINENEGPEHERLKTELEEWAKKKGYDKNGPRFESSIPDVVLTNQEGNKLFVGDAKDAEHETVNDEGTISQIKGYVEEFLRFIKNGEYKGGIFLIATNKQNAAEGWCGLLSELAKTIFDNQEIKTGKTWLSWHRFSK